jgi:hypothetical protein
VRDIATIQLVGEQAFVSAVAVQFLKKGKKKHPSSSVKHFGFYFEIPVSQHHHLPITISACQCEKLSYYTAFRFPININTYIQKRKRNDLGKLVGVDVTKRQTPNTYRL